MVKKRKDFHNFQSSLELKILRYLGRAISDVLVNLDWKILWYSLFLWVMTIVFSGIVILPWFYLVLTIFVLLVTIIFFRVDKRIWNREGRIFSKGLQAAFFWPIIIFLLDFMEFVGLDLANAFIYFSDPRSWFKFPILILMPIIYSIVLENIDKRSLHGSSLSGQLI